MNAQYLTKDGKAIIHLGSRDVERELRWHKIAGYVPHFWAVNPKGSHLDHFRRPIVRVDAEHPHDVSKLREKYRKTLEADIKFSWRYLFDKNIKCGYGIEDNKIFPADHLDIPPKKGLFDIEVESPPEIMAKPEKPIYPIVSFQFADSYTEQLTIFMLKTRLPTWETVEKPSYLLGCKRALTLPVDFIHRGKTETVHPIIYLYEQEKPMVWDVIQWFRKQEFDTSGGYFSSIFDWPYWINRAKAFHLDVNRLSPFDTTRCTKPKLPEYLKKFYRRKRRYDTYIKGLQVIDVAQMYGKWAGGRQPIVKDRPFGVTMDFHRVMEHECDFHYVDLGDRVHASRTKDPVGWLEYCVGDAYALLILEKEKGIIKFFDRLRRIVGCPLQWAIHNSRLIDTRLLRLRERPLPTRHPVESERVKGAIVFLPDIGIHENVAVIDEKSLYPMCIVVYNLGSDTLVLSKKDWRADDIIVGPMEDGTVLHFRSKPQSLLAKCVQHDMEEREFYRSQIKGMSETNPRYEMLKMMETLHRFLACSYYGVTGYEGFRLANDDVRSAITFLGRKHLTECKNDLQREGYRTRYGDTDSLFVQLHSTLKEEGRIIENIVNRTLNRIARKFGAMYFIEAKYEHYCKRVIFVPKITRKKGVIVAAKKRYAYTDEKDQLFVVGMAPRSSATSAIVRKRMLEWLDLILVHKDVKGATKIIRDLWENLENYPIQQVAIPRGVHKTKYADKHGRKRKDPWKDGVDWMSKFYGLTFREDKRPMLIYMRKRPDVSPVICINETMEELPAKLALFVDWPTMKEKIVKKKFLTLFEAIGIEWTEVIAEKTQAQLKVKKIPRGRIKGSKPIPKKRMKQADMKRWAK